MALVPAVIANVVIAGGYLPGIGLNYLATLRRVFVVCKEHHGIKFSELHTIVLTQMARLIIIKVNSSRRQINLS